MELQHDINMSEKLCESFFLCESVLVTFFLLLCPGPGGLPAAEQQADRRHRGSGSGEAVQTDPGDPGSPGGAGRPRPRRSGHAGAERRA